MVLFMSKNSFTFLSMNAGWLTGALTLKSSALLPNLLGYLTRRLPTSCTSSDSPSPTKYNPALVAGLSLNHLFFFQFPL